MANVVFVSRSHHCWRERVGAEDRFGGKAASEQRLTDAFAGERVGCRRCVAHEQHAVVSENGLIDSSRNRPCSVATLEHSAFPEGLANVWAAEQIGPQRVHLLHLDGAATEHAESNVDAAIGKRKRPRVAGHDVGIEPHVETIRRGARHVVCILTKAVPLAEIPGLANAECFTHRRPHAVGSDHVTSAYQTDVFNVDHDVLRRLLDNANKPVAIEHRGTRSAGVLEQCVVEFDAWRDGSELSLPGER